MAEDNIVNLDRWSGRRQHEAGAAAHARRQAFAFAPYVFNDDGFGSIETGEVVFLTNEDDLSGIRMSVDDALATGAALIQAALGARLAGKE